MSDGGKGSSPRPYSIDKETFNKNWDAIFKLKKDFDDAIMKNEYYDILTTEDCMIDEEDSSK